MRLTEFEIKSIKESFQEFFDKGDSIWLFGSRVDDTKRGGDIDLYIETNCEDLTEACTKERNLWTSLQFKLGLQKIDIVLNCLKIEKKERRICIEARNTGIKLV